MPENGNNQPANDEVNADTHNENNDERQTDDRNAGQGHETGQQENDNSSSQAENLDDLPEYWQKQIKDLRKENADRRAAVRDTSSEKKSQADRIAALEQELADRRAAEDAAHKDMQKTKLLADRGYSTDLSHMLTGDSPEEWEADIELLESLVSNKGPTPDPVQVAASNPAKHKSEGESIVDAESSGDYETASRLKAKKLGSLAKQYNS